MTDNLKRAMESNDGYEVIEARLEASRKELLDLSYRNTLLNYHELSARGIHVVDELAAEVLRLLYINQRAMTFAPIPETEKDGAEDPPGENDYLEVYLALHREDEAKGNDNGASARHVDSVLQTKYVDAVLERRLLNTYHMARTSLEEQGVNILFMALGMLHWADPGQPEKAVLAPIVLLPVTLSRRSARSSFKVEYNGDELGSNVSLQAKLHELFGAGWPVIDDPEAPEDFDLTEYFDQCQAVVDKHAGWRLDRNEIHLGFFSFHKFIMYQDLDPARWGAEASIGKHETVAALLGDAGFRQEEPVIPVNAHLDTLLNPGTLFHVADSDSSQSEVLAEIASGKSMVVQGPPGTGKSQTITNLIAQCVANGKSVLFVAEKMAALEVVKRRLDNMGLGDIALELHSNKTNKRQFLDNLKEVWEKGPPFDADYDADLRQLTDTIQELNRHADETNTPVRNSGRAIFSIYGRIMVLSKRLSGESIPALNIDGWHDWSDEHFVNAQNLAQQLEVLTQEIGVLAEHPFRDARLTAVLPSEVQEVAAAAAMAYESSTELVTAVDRLRESLGLHRELSLRELDGVTKQIWALINLPDLSGLPVENRAWFSERETLVEIIAYTAQIQNIVSKLSGTLTDKAWTHPDAAALAGCLGGFTSVWYRWFIPTYRAAAKKAEALWRIKPPFNLQRRVDSLRSIVDVQKARKELTDNEAAMSSLFGGYWLQDGLDLRVLTAISDGLYGLHNSGLAPEVVLAIASASDVEHLAGLAPLVQAVESCRIVYGDRLAKLMSMLEVSKQTNNNDCEFGDYLLDVQREFLQAWLTSPQKMLPIARYNAMRRMLSEKGLQPLMDASEHWSSSGHFLALLFEQRWLESLLKQHLKDHPDMSQFSPGLADRWVSQFREADIRMFRHNRVRVLKAHYGNLPSPHGAGEMALLNREFNKKSRHLPIRILMDKAGRAIQRAKPVFMMSPFSVATYLPRGGMQFDTVIFDEASQVRPVDAFGAIARGKQVVVVGDSRQLPPTSFFERLQGDDSDDESETRDIESILKQFAAKGAFSRMLRWHYRSRHNSLIEYSNHGFYGGNLTVFPSPISARDTMGLHFEHVPDGVYERGATKRRNSIEAERVAEAVMEHARQHPTLSLGIGAFSMPQMQEVLDRVEILRRQTPECEAFFAAHPDEPFFVKNLENIQGDERDVIFISVGYGRTDAGTISMNFGPLNNEGGERRLNVLITRAKQRCVVFSNITADDIDLSRTNSEGVRHLKGYLQFAEKGYIDHQEPGNREPDSPFEIEVAAAIRTLGYEVHYQIGSAGYFVDLAIVDPAVPGRYLLGIECDGASYHSSRWARDRDRLRQQVLEGLGWTIHRIWSKSWFEDPESELKKVKAAGDKAQREGPVRTTPAPASSVSVIERAEPTVIDLSHQSVPYEVAVLKKMRRIVDFETVHDETVQRMLMQVISVESPVFAEEAMKRVLSATGVARMNSRIRDKFEAALEVLRNAGQIRLDEDVVWDADHIDVRVRDRSAADTSKKIEHVPLAEIKKACVLVVSQACSITMEDLHREILCVLGLGALTQSRRDYLDGVVAKFMVMGWVKEDNGRILLGGE